jgi:hypothetical protein
MGTAKEDWGGLPIALAGQLWDDEMDIVYLLCERITRGLRVNLHGLHIVFGEAT